MNAQSLFEAHRLCLTAPPPLPHTHTHTPLLASASQCFQSSPAAGVSRRYTVWSVHDVQLFARARSVFLRGPLQCLLCPVSPLFSYLMSARLMNAVIVLGRRRSWEQYVLTFSILYGIVALRSLSDVRFEGRFVYQLKKTLERTILLCLQLEQPVLGMHTFVWGIVFVACLVCIVIFNVMVYVYHYCSNAYMLAWIFLWTKFKVVYNRCRGKFYSVLHNWPQEIKICVIVEVKRRKPYY